MYDVWARGRGGFGHGIKSAVQHFFSPAHEDGGGAGTPLRYGDEHVLPSFFKVQRDGGVVCEGRKSTFGRIENILVFGTNSSKLVQFIGVKDGRRNR